MKTCLLIPNYNHGKTMDALLTRLMPFNLPCIIVDDGSEQTTKRFILAAKEKFSFVTSVITLKENQGKGKAIFEGMKHAQSLGFSHAIQIDADGQHDTRDIQTFL